MKRPLLVAVGAFLFALLVWTLQTGAFAVDGHTRRQPGNNVLRNHRYYEHDSVKIEKDSSYLMAPLLDGRGRNGVIRNHRRFGARIDRNSDNLVATAFDGHHRNGVIRNHRRLVTGFYEPHHGNNVIRNHRRTVSGKIDKDPGNLVALVFDGHRRNEVVRNHRRMVY